MDTKRYPNSELTLLIKIKTIKKRPLENVYLQGA